MDSYCSYKPTMSFFLLREVHFMFLSCSKACHISHALHLKVVHSLSKKNSKVYITWTFTQIENKWNS